ncbi:MAG TPA: four helix bundle protein [Opitutus sp.]|nr:four helix bundle protein [Opitutus sp.]
MNEPVRQDLRQRTFDFAVRIARLVEALPRSDSIRSIANQLLRAGTSVGANYRAARRSRSKAEFIAKLGIVEEECDEAIYWIELLVALGALKSDRTQALLDEANQLLAITISSIKTARTTVRKQ